MIKYGRDCLMLAMSSCADEYDSERHLALDYGKDLASRWTSVRELRAVESDEPVNYRWIGRFENIAREG
jgi:hypothetical protein